mgnify:FL=1
MENFKNKHKIGRTMLKFKKYKYNHNYIVSMFYISAFTIKTFLNLILLKINILLSSNNQKQKRVLFIEPSRQGYGDLLFQIPLFFILNNNGFTVDVLIQQKHSAIIDNNPNIKNIFYWNKNLILEVLKKEHDIVIGLGRDTIRTNVLMLLKFSNKKIIPDADIKSWHEAFKKNNPSVAWQIIVFRNFLDNNLFIEKPKIYFSKEELKEIRQKSESPNRSILFIAGVNRKLKRYPFWGEVIKKFNDNYKIQLLNPDNDLINSVKGFKITIIKTSTYREAILTIVKTNIIIGTEGSLIHIAVALGKKIVALDADFSFRKQTFMNIFENVIILNNHICHPWYEKNKKEMIRLCFLDKNGLLIKNENPCLKNISPNSVIEAIKNFKN